MHLLLCEARVPHSAAQWDRLEARLSRSVQYQKLRGQGWQVWFTPGSQLLLHGGTPGDFDTPQSLATHALDSVSEDDSLTLAVPTGPQSHFLRYNQIDS